MKILSLSYEDLETGWKVENATFDDLNLLVGASGVGKTMLLKAIRQLRALLKRQKEGYLRSIEWKFLFEDYTKHQWTWTGETSASSKELVFVQEQLFYGETCIAQRHADGEVEYYGRSMARLNRTTSVITLIEEGKIAKAKRALQRIRYITPYAEKYFIHKRREAASRAIDHYRKEQQWTQQQLEQLYQELGVLPTLLLLQERSLQVLEIIKQSLFEVFPNIEDIKVRKADLREYERSEQSEFTLYFKEEGVEQWLPHYQVSSGMLRTLYLATELQLCPEGTVFLIDEIENSLGVNCMDELINKLVMTNRDLQFIMTSHHPYIINNIHHSNWKLVTRRGSEVVLQDVDELIDIEQSKQEAFVQLTQLEQFHTGLTA